MTPELAAIIAMDYAQMPEPGHKPVEWWDELEARRIRREQQREDDYNNSGRI